MSRIAGVVSIEKDKPRLLDTMLTRFSAQDGWQTITEDQSRAKFGWRGFSVPNIVKRGNVIVAIDGRIYNRDELGGGESDADLVALLYSRHGFEETVHKLNGDFAIALYDTQSEKLWLARDRFGVKPIYYAVGRDFFAFASQPGALLSLPGVSREVNNQFVALFAASHYRYFDNDLEKSPYRDIVQLPAAHILSVKDGQLAKKSYWSLSDSPDFTESEEELARRLRELFLDAVALRLKSAERPAFTPHLSGRFNAVRKGAGFTLSGGMDSSSILASAAKVSGEKQHAFSVIYDDPTYDESREIKSMLSSHVAEWHPVKVAGVDIPATIEKMIAVNNEPVATATWLSHFLLCEEASRLGFSSLFGGLGGDELNAGEYEYFFFFFADLKAAGRNTELKSEIEKWITHHDHPIFRKNFGVVEDSFKHLVDFSKPGICLPDKKRLLRYKRALNADYFNLGDFTPVMDSPFSSYLKNRTFQDIYRETIPCCFRAEDRQTTAFGLGNFLPFFDYRLVEFMFRIPGDLKIRNGITKYLLREAMRGILPEETRTRIKKTGWNAPAHLWFSGRGREMVLDLVHSQSFRERGIYNVDEVLRLIDEHERVVSSGVAEENHMMFLWQLVNLELWFKWLERM